MSAIQMDWVSMISFIVGIVGLIISIYQTYAMDKIKKVYMRKNAERCKNFFSLVSSIVDEIGGACKIINTECKYKGAAECSTLTAKVNSIKKLSEQLSTFCHTLNQEHKENYHIPIDPDLDKKIRHMNCLSETNMEQSSHSVN